MAITKPAVKPVWSENSTTSADMVTPTDGQIQTGWPLSTTPPSRQRWNWLLNYCMNAVRYFSRRGIADYDAAETFEIGDVARGDDGLIYRSQVAGNINHTPSSSPTQWGCPIVPTAPADDNGPKVASTGYVLGQLSVSLPGMNGTAAVGTSKKIARADHVHPPDSSKANTSGSYLGLSVGSATVASQAPWSGITGKPTSVVTAGFTDAIHAGNIGSQSVAFAANAERAYPRRWDGNPISIVYSGQGGQPNWLLGSNDGSNFYVWNPANFSVNYATTAGYSDSAAYASYGVTQPLYTSNASLATTAFANPGSVFGYTGYTQLPSGMIWQWGYTQGAAGGGPVNCFFPVSFPNLCLHFIASKANRTGGGSQGGYVNGFNNSYGVFYCDVQDNGLRGCYWEAKGY